jgi:hypothetical protein
MPLRISGYCFFTLGVVQTLIAIKYRRQIKMQKDSWGDVYFKDALRRNNRILFMGIVCLVAGIASFF